MEQQYDFLVKLLLVGSESTGKSTILMRYINDSFTDSYISTIGVDFMVKTLQFPSSNGGTSINAKA